MYLIPLVYLEEEYFPLFSHARRRFYIMTI
jgi:hypothetical protein